jgi:uncharacterized protein with HEPN domain
VKDDTVYLHHVLESIRRIEENTAGGHGSFIASHTLQDAVLRNLQTMAESTQRLSNEVKTSTPSIDWRALAGLRNVLTHNYLGIDLEQIWSIVVRDVPTLKRAAVALLRDRPVG